MTGLDPTDARAGRDNVLWALVGVFLAAFFIQSAVSLESESITFDEPIAIGGSYAAFRAQDLSAVRERIPILGLFTVLPIRFLAADPGLPPSVADPKDIVGDVKYGLAFFQSNNAILITRISRYCVLSLSLLMGAVLVLWSRRLGGLPAAVLASALFALCPNLLAHSHVAINDMPVTIFVFIAVWALDRYWSAPSVKTAVLAGLCLGLAPCGKLSGAAILPLYAVVAASLLRQRGPSEGKKRLAWEAVALVAAAFFSIGVAMGGTFDYARFFSAFGKIYTNADQHHRYYMAGHVSDKTWWYYYFYAAAIKTPLPFLGLTLSGGWLLLRDRLQRRSALLALGAIALFMGVGCFDTANIGLRHVLPIYPFMILIAAQSVRLPLRPALKAPALAALLSLQAVSVSRAAPYYLTYFNELVGGPAGGIYCLDDSNIDEGQGLIALRGWIKAHPGVPFSGVYYGLIPPEVYGIHLPEIAYDDICSPRAGVYAMSAHLLVHILKKGGENCSWLHRFTPVERLANSIFIYDFRNHQSGVPRAESQPATRPALLFH